MQGISIIIPTLNEVDNIEDLLSRIVTTIKNNQLQETEIIIVDDGSTDGTLDHIKKWQEKYPINLILRANKKGLASAVIEGARVAENENVLVIDGDLSHPPEMIPELLSPIDSGNYDLVIGSRYIKGGATPDWPIRRRITSRVATLLAWPFIDVKDPMSGFFCVQKKLLAELPLDTPGFKIGFEILVRNKASLRIFEVPIIFRDRQKGKSKLGFPEIKAFLGQLLQLAGGNVSISNGSKFALVGLLGLIMDLTLFNVLRMTGASLGSAHTLSFFAATISNFILNARWSFPEKSKLGIHKKYFAFVVVALLALFIRGGILATLTEAMELPPQLAIVIAVGAAAIINYLGCAFWVFPQKTDTFSEQKWRLLVIGIVAYTILLRLAYMGIGELMQEEAYYWNYAQHLDIGYLDHPPMVAWIIWFNTYIFGNTEFGVRIGALLSWIIAGGFMFGLTRNLFDKTAAFRAVLLLAIMPFFFGMGLLMFPDSPLVACWAGALFFLERSLIAKKRLAWYGLGVCLGLGMLSKYTIVLLGPAILIFLLLDRNSRKWLVKPEPYLAAIIALLIFSPVIIWNASNDWASFYFQGPRRWNGSLDFSLHLLIGSILVLLTPTGLAAAIFLIFPGRKRPIKNFLSLLVKNHKSLFALIFSLTPLAVFFFFSLSREVKLNWTGPLWLALLPFIAFHMKQQQGNRYQLIINRAWPGTILASILVYGAFLHYLTLGFPGLPYPKNFHLIGWQDFSRQIDLVEDQITEINNEKAIVIGMDKYSLASRLAFYRTKISSSPEQENHEKVQLTSGEHIFGGNSLMYKYWMDKYEMKDKLMILVSRDKKSLTTPDIISHFQYVSPIHDVPLTKNGLIFGKYFYRIAGKYDPVSSPITEVAVLAEDQINL